MIFETGQLSPGQHKLIVGYNGNGSTVPLFFNYFVQQDGLGPSSTSSGPLASGTSMSSSSSVSSSSTTIVRQPIEAIIGGVIGRLILIFLLIALLFFNRRSKNWKLRALSEMSYTAPFPYVALANSFNLPSSNPASIFLPEDYTSNGQSLPSQFISGKFTQTHRRSQSSDPSSMSSIGDIPSLTPLRPLRRPQFSSPVFISPSPSSLPLSGSQTNFDGTRFTVPQAETESFMQRSSPRGANARFLRYEDSGVRIPAAEDEVFKLPPFYTPG